MDFKESFDVVTLIFYDFCVLSTEEQRILLVKIHKALKTGGFFVFDVVTENMEVPITTNIAVFEEGFWSAKPYVEIQQNFMYDNPKTLGQQYMIIAEDGATKIQRFYNRMRFAFGEHSHGTQIVERTVLGFGNSLAVTRNRRRQSGIVSHH